MKIIDRIGLLAVTAALVINVYTHESSSCIAGWFCALLWCIRTNFDKK